VAADRLLPLLDLSRPEMVRVKALADQGNQVEALRTWRDLLLARMRRLDYHEYYQHDYSRHPRQTGIADMLTGVVSREDYLADASKTGFLDIFGMAGAPDRSRVISWFTRAEDVADWGNAEINGWSVDKKRTKVAYGAMHFGRSFVARYWETGNPAYRDKIMNLMDRFVTDHPRLFWEAYERGEVEPHNRDIGNYFYVDWRQNVNALDACVRARNFAIFQAGLAKCLGNDKPDEWSEILASRAAPLTREQTSLLPADQMADIAASLFNDHAPKIMWFVSGPGVPNQRLDGLKTLLILSYTYPNFRHAPELLRTFETNMDKVLADNYLPDGGNLEQSFNYNHGEIRELQVILDFFGEDLPPFAKRLQQRIVARRAMDDGLRTPLGGLPQVGNHSSFTSTGKDTWSSPEAWTKYQTYRQQQGQPYQPEPQPYLSKGYPYSGYYAMRGSWDWQSPYLFFMAGRPQSGHSMHDANSIQVSALGRNFVVCDGAPTYGFRNTPETEYAADAVDEGCGWKVNTVLVDGKCQARDETSYSRAPTTPVSLRWHTSSQFDFIDNTCDRGFWNALKPNGKPDHSVAHQRTVTFVRAAGLWLMEDRMDQLDETPHTYSQVWNFPPKYGQDDEYARSRIDGFTPKQFDLEPTAKRFATADPQGPNLEFIHLTPGSIGYRKFYGDKEKLKGWFAPGLGSLCAAPDVYADWNSTDSNRLVTLLVPRPKDGSSPIAKLERETSKQWFGFNAQLADGASLAYRTADVPTPLAIGSVKAVGASLLVHEQNGTLSGIVTDAKTLDIGDKSIALTDSCAEFTHRNGQTTVTAIPLQRSPQIADAAPFLPGDPVPPLTIKGEKGFQIRYTLDGSDPTADSPLYDGPVALGKPAVVKARYFRGTEPLPFISTCEYLPTNRPPRPADYPLTLQVENGLHCDEIRNAPTRIYDLMLKKPVRSFTRTTWRIDEFAKEKDFGLKQTCLVRIPKTGFWQFHIKRGNTATATIGICNPKVDLPTRPFARVGWWAEEATGSIPLEAGYHQLEIQYGCFYKPDNGLEIEIEGPGTPRQPLPDAWLYQLP
jgi:hypothetical protein